MTPEILNFVERTKNDPILNQISLADAGGDLLLSAVPHDRPINISQREHFQVHAASRRRGAVHRQTGPGAGVRHLDVLPQPAA